MAVPAWLSEAEVSRSQPAPAGSTAPAVSEALPSSVQPGAVEFMNDSAMGNCARAASGAASRAATRRTRRMARPGPKRSMDISCSFTPVHVW